MNTEENIPDGDVPTARADAPTPGTDAPAPHADAPTPHVDAPAPPERPARPRRRPLRTLGLIAVAAVLGVVGGTAVGYGVQAERPPVPLPALNQPGLAYPAKPLPKGQEPEPLSAKEDLQLKAEGDLRKLLLPKPEGARGGEGGWMSLADYADSFTQPDGALESDLEQKIRRIAVRTWSAGENRRVKIELAQYRPSSGMGAYEHVRGQQAIAIDEARSGSLGEPVKGSENGRYFVYPVERKAGYLDFHQARAFIQHGDIAITILVFDTRKITKNEIRSLAERQLGRL
ncbi:hypothetical protein [Streptomyces sp. NPDC091278]|uniref:hypothetical protein n=1 Tax=Streptomyces sp. NPDC091278 TaxID=3155301 RepID=UPI00344C3BF8